jgi:uncharacterized RDD family membrane protein YckC
MTGIASRAVGPGHAQHVRPVQGAPAGLATRAAADVVDFAVLSGILGSVYLGYTAFRFLRRPRTFTFPAPSLALVIGCAMALAWVYFSLCWAGSGRTYGALVLGLRVVARNGSHPHLAVATVRAFLCVAVPIGLVWCVVDPRRRSLQDLVVRTCVVYDWPD